MSNSLYPGFVKIQYTVQSRPHRMIVPVSPYQTIGGEWWLSEKNDSVGQLWTTAIQAFFDVLTPFFNTGDFAVSGAELWTIAAPGDDPIFQENVALTIGTTAGSTTVSYNEVVFTFRTSAGGILKLYLMETVNAVNLKKAAPSYGGATTMEDLHDFIVGDGCPVMGRDGAFASVGLFAHTKTNDALRKKYIG